MEAGLVRDGEGGVYEWEALEWEGGEIGAQRANSHFEGFAHKSEAVGAKSVNRSLK